MNTTVDTVLGSKALQVSDFYELAGILHPVAIGVYCSDGSRRALRSDALAPTGSIAIVGFFIYLRLSSNRTIAP